MMFDFDDNLKQFLDYCKVNKIDVYLVGGAVRDFFMGNKTYDLDFALTSEYDKALWLLSREYKCETYPTYQAIKLKVNEYNIEITHCRIEREYLDYRHPNVIEFTTDIKLDSKRRDFTMNALYYKDSKIYDFYNGIDDIKNKKIRVIGDTLTRFKEDPLRILRMIRFSSLGFDISKEDKRIIKDHVYLLSELKQDVFFSEFDKILNINNLYVIWDFKEIFEEYFNTKFKDIAVLNKLQTIDEKKTYLNIKNKSLMYKYKDVYISDDYIEIAKLVYKLSKEVVYQLLLYHDRVYDDHTLDTFNNIINNGFYSKKQLNISPKEIQQIIKKNELTSYYIDEISYSIINGKIKNDKEEIIKYIMEINK